MAFTQADLDLIDEMIAGNVLESETADGKRVKFGSYKELIARRGFIERAIRGNRRPTFALVSFIDNCGSDEGEGC